MKMRSAVNRREFLKTTTAAAAGMSLLGAWDQAEAKPGKGMFITLSYQPGWYAPAPAASAGDAAAAAFKPPRLGWLEMVQMAAKLGYGGANLSLAPAMLDGVDKTRALYSDLKLRPGFFGMPVNPFATDEAAFQKSLTQLDDVCAFASAVDCQRSMFVVPTSTDVPKEELRKIALDRARAMSEVLERHKIRVGLEFLGPLYFRTRRKYEFITNLHETVEFCKEAGPNWGAVLDTWHWYHSGGTIADIIAAGKDRIIVVHIDDAKKMPPEDVRDNMRVLPGEGIIDLVGIFKTLKKIGYADAVMPEVIGRMPDSWTVEETAKASLDSTRAVLKKAGINT